MLKLACKITKQKVVKNYPNVEQMKVKLELIDEKGDSKTCKQLVLFESVLMCLYKLIKSIYVNSMHEVFNKAVKMYFE